MPACHASHVIAEEIDSGQRCTQAVTSDTMRAVLETWCDHELRWVVYGHDTPPVWAKSHNTCAGTRDLMGVRGPPGGQSQGGLYRDL
jgi:hypothetical protein